MILIDFGDDNANTSCLLSKKIKSWTNLLMLDGFDIVWSVDHAKLISINQQKKTRAPLSREITSFTI